MNCRGEYNTQVSKTQILSKACSASEALHMSMSSVHIICSCVHAYKKYTHKKAEKLIMVILQVLFSEKSFQSYLSYLR